MKYIFITFSGLGLPIAYKLKQEGHEVTFGQNWSTAIITGAGKTIDDAVVTMYKNVEGFSFVGAYYRYADDYLSKEEYSSTV